MKAAAVILSLFVLFLNAIPCCWNDCEEDDFEVHTEQGSGSQDSCSPFLSCGSCTGFVIYQDFPEIPLYTSFFQLPDEQEEETFSSDFSYKIWQPPKRVNDFSVFPRCKATSVELFLT